jgi:hypothetical protein
MLCACSFNLVLRCQSAQKQCDGLFTQSPCHGDGVLGQDLLQVNAIKGALQGRLIALHQGGIDRRQRSMHVQS